MTVQKMQTGAAIFLALFALLPLFGHMASNDNHKNYANHNYGKNLMNTLEPNSVFMTEGGDNQVFTSAYNQMAMQLRPDVRIYDQKGNVFYRIYGDFRYMTQQEVDIKRDIVDFEIFSRGRPVYLTWKRTPAVAACGDWFLKRYGILFKVVPLKYQILEDLEADRELPLDKVRDLLSKYYTSEQNLEKLRKNLKELDWYEPAIMGVTGQSPHFISDEERTRLRRAVVEYRAWLTQATERKVDAAFTINLLRELEGEGYLRVEGNTVVFVRDLPAPLGGEYWSRYIFDYQNVGNAVDWDYLTREILTNYNFYFAEYCREMIEKFERQKAFYERKIAQGRTPQLEAALATVVSEIKRYTEQEQRSYREAAYYGYDMAAIHHNLGAIYMQRGETSAAVASFHRGMAADQYSYPTIYSYILLRLREAAESFKPEVEEEALRETGALVNTVLGRLKKTYRLDDEGMAKDQTVQQFARLVSTLIAPRTNASFSMKTVVRLRQQIATSPDDHTLQLQYLTLLYQRQDTEGVVRAFDGFPASKWENEMLVYYYGNSQQQNGDVDDAIATFERLAREKPEFALGVFRLAQMYDILKRDTRRALEVYRRILTLSEAGVNARYPAYARYFQDIKKNAKQRVDELERVVR